MQRALTTLELYKRENLRRRKEAQRLAPAVVARGGGARLMVDRTSSSADLDGSSSGDGADGGTGLTAARGSTAYDRGVSEALLDEFEQMKIQLAEAQAEAAAARKLSESRERYLAVVDTQAAEQHSRNEAQQRRLEHLSSENSKLRRELTRLRAETSAERMEVFEMEMLKQELKGAKVADCPGVGRGDLRVAWENPGHALCQAATVHPQHSRTSEVPVATCASGIRLRDGTATDAHAQRE